MQRRQKQIQPTDVKMKAIGAVVREFRERAGHSQERLSGEYGFDRTYISRVERGIINPTVGRLWQIADALKTPLSQLTKRMELWIAEQVRVPSDGEMQNGPDRLEHSANEGRLSMLVAFMVLHIWSDRLAKESSSHPRSLLATVNVGGGPARDQPLV